MIDCQLNLFVVELHFYNTFKLSLFSILFTKMLTFSTKTFIFRHYILKSKRINLHQSEVVEVRITVYKELLKY